MLYTSGSEAPSRMHFWVGVSTIAGALRKHVWLDEVRFVWTPSFYIILVAPPGVVSKTTTMDLGLSLLRSIPGINFGPDAVTWQALVTRFAEAGESFQWGDSWIPQSALTLASGELGNLINPQERDLINFYITMWDGRRSFEKVTKASGNDLVEAPWINMIGCTTPHWIADNMPQATVGGGFTSRCVFVYADHKEAFVAYPSRSLHRKHTALHEGLVEDLHHISTALVGPMSLTEEAVGWGEEWYRRLWTEVAPKAESGIVEGYLARKQTHLHKLAMVLSAARGDDLTITLEDLVVADQMLAETEKDLEKVFSRIGRSEEAGYVERLLVLIKNRGRVPYVEAYRYIHTYFPDFRDFEGILNGCIRSGQVKLTFQGSDPEKDAVLVWTGG